MLMSRVVGRLVVAAQRVRYVSVLAVESARDGIRFLFNRHLLFTNISVAVGLSGLGDVMNQSYEVARRSRGSGGWIAEWSKRRTVNQCTQGLLFGVLYHYWYIFLDERMPGRTTRAVLRKLAADQLFMVPVSVFIFVVLIDSLEGRTARQTFTDVREKGPSLLAVEWSLGTPTQLFNFYFLPTRFRVVYDCTITLCFDSLYAHVKYRTESSSDLEHKSAVNNRAQAASSDDQAEVTDDRNMIDLRNICPDKSGNVDADKGDDDDR